MNEGHFKLGLFVTVAAGLLVAFLLALGVLARFRPTVGAETYFLEPIQNLQTGAPVRFRGVQVGVVDWIGFASSHYRTATLGSEPGTYRSYIMVTMRLYSDTLMRAGVENVGAQIRANVEAGLRARLATTGLGGPTYVEVDILDPATFPPPAIGWEPDALYIPSAPSAVVSIIDSLDLILRQVEEHSVIGELGIMLARFDAVLDDVETSKLVAATDSTLGELRAASSELRSLLGDPRLDGVLDDAQATLRGTRNLLETDRGSIETLVVDMTQMAATLDRAGSSLEAVARAVQEQQLVSRVRAAAEQLGPAGRDLSALSDRLDRLVSANEQQVADAIRSLRDAALELTALLEELKADPSRILADPPPRGTPGGGS